MRGVLIIVGLAAAITLLAHHSLRQRQREYLETAEALEASPPPGAVDAETRDDAFEVAAAETAIARGP